jgi:hypothetical protein
MPGVSDERQGDDEKAEQSDDGIRSHEEHSLAKGGVVEVGRVEEEVGYGESGECRRCGHGEYGSRCHERYAQDDGEAEGCSTEVSRIVLAERRGEGDGRQVVVEAFGEGPIPEPDEEFVEEKIR